MTEYIDRETFLKDIEERYCLPCKEAGRDHNGCKCRACWVDDMCGEVIDAPAADVAPVRYGRWVKSEDDYDKLYMIKCSMCREEWYFECDDDVFDLNYHYCPNCGARMDGGADDGC